MKWHTYGSGRLFEAAPEGGGGGTPPAFDAAAFRTSLLGDVKTLLTGFTTTLKADLAEQLAAGAPPPSPPSGDPPPSDPPVPGTPPKATADAALAAEVRALIRKDKERETQMTAMKKESEETKAAANKKELDATIRTKLTKFKFADAQAGEDAFEIFGSKVKRDEAGNFVGPDNTPIDQYLEEGMRSKPYLLAPKDVAGGGVRPGGAPARPPGKAIDFDAIKPGMSAEDATAASQQILAALNAPR
jgi:hypothetical protein